VIYETLLEQLSDPSEEVRETAVWTLGQLFYREAGKRLAKLLRTDPCVFVRWAAAEAMATMRDASSITSLVSALEDGDVMVRMVVVSALGRLRDPRAVDDLKRALEREENAPIREQILDVLYRITGVTHRYLTAEQKKIEKYRQEVDANPQNGHARYNLAVAYFHSKLYAQAREHCETARQLGTGVGWLRRRLDELPPDAFTLPPEGEAGTGVPPGEHEAVLEGDLAFDSGDVDEAHDNPDVLRDDDPA
jgi:tetratricopeptide (TPR) repeat protein